MIRYVDCFFRYWLIVLIPIIVFPLVEGMQLRHTVHQIYASFNIYVQPSVMSANSANSWMTPAQVEQTNISQWLQSPSFCLSVAQGSPLYARLLAHAIDPQNQAGNDLTRNVQVSPRGDNLLTIGYTATNPQLAMQVLTSLLDKATTRTVALQARQTALDKSYYEYQLHSAELQERDSAQKLSDYMQAHDINNGNLHDLLPSDLTLATLYQQNVSDRQNVTNLQAKINDYGVQSSILTSAVDQKGYFVADPPSYSVVSSSKKKELMSLGIALLLGLLFGGGFLVVLTAMDRTARYAQEIPGMLGLPVLAIVPQSTLFARQQRAARSPSTTRAATVKGA